MNSRNLVQAALLLLAVCALAQSKPPAPDPEDMEVVQFNADATQDRNQKIVAEITTAIAVANQMVKLGKSFLGAAFNRKTFWTDAFGYECQYHLTGRFCDLLRLKYRFIGRMECKDLGKWSSADCLKRKDSTAFEVPYRDYIVTLCRGGADKKQLIQAINNRKEIRPLAKADIIQHLHAKC